MVRRDGGDSRREVDSYAIVQTIVGRASGSGNAVAHAHRALMNREHPVREEDAMTTISVTRQPRITRVRAERAWPGPRAPSRLGSPKEVCSACGAVTEVEEGVPYVRQEDARFCTRCWPS